MKLTVLFLVIAQSVVFSQSYAPLPGEPGSTAIHKDSSVITAWATGVIVTRGPMDIANPGSGDASFGTDSDAIGLATGTGVVSLGDGGSAIVTFASPISNVPGYDFAVFENGFTNNYIELAFVEVSSDGVNYIRFDAISEAPIDPQYWNGSYSDCRFFNNLAGKYKANYGTPFDLEELNGVSGLDINAITHIKIIDVIGNVNPTYASYDSQGSIINDPYPTPFESGGFDLDAIAVLSGATAGISTNKIITNVYPNPSTGIINVQLEGVGTYSIQNNVGQIIKKGVFNEAFSVDLTELSNGNYFLFIDNENGIAMKRLTLRK